MGLFDTSNRTSLKNSFLPWVLLPWLWLGAGCARGASGVRIGPEDPHLYYMGRVQRNGAQGTRMAWSGTGVRARFTGSRIAVVLKDELPKPEGADAAKGLVLRNYFQASIDDGPPVILAGNSVPTSYQLAEGLPPGEHTLVLAKRTEALVGTAEFLGLELAPGTHLVHGPKPRRQIVFVGDSLTAGYGNEGVDSSCPFSPETENFSKTYAGLSAQNLEAEAVALAWSGRGVVRNYEGEPVPTMAQMWNRALPRGGEAPSACAEVQEKPDAIVVNLGGNDFSPPDPPQGFGQAYEALLASLRSCYGPEVPILCVVGPMLSDSWKTAVPALSTARRDILGALERRKGKGDAHLFFLEFPEQTSQDGFGCDYHPSAAKHRAMAQVLQARLREIWATERAGR